MPIRVKIATTPIEMDSLFKARYAVFVEEERYLKERGDRRIFDQFDTFPSTVNLIAMVDMEVVGGLRVTVQSEAGTSSDDLFDFSEYLPRRTEKTGAASMLCMRKIYRDVPRLTFMLLCMGVYWAISKELSHVVAAINPLIEPLLRAIGFKPVGSRFHHEAYGIDVLPMILEMNQLEENFLEMAKFQGFQGSLKTFEREFYKADEQIIKSGVKGDAAYVVVDGMVTVCRPARRADDPPKTIINELGPGEIFGELSLLTNEPRSADVFASTDVDLMVIDKEIFHSQLLDNPTLQRRLLELLGRRLRSFYIPIPRSLENL
jgi:N-acyl-L-homoserine lactone synthetase